jgi:hypothetical protein
VVAAGEASVGGFRVTEAYTWAILGLVLGCLSMLVEVPDRGALRHEISAPTVTGGGYE